jgi:elongator complex protein 3
MGREKTWLEAHQYTSEQLRLARAILEDIREGRDVLDAIRRHPLSMGGFIGKHILVHVYRDLTQNGEWAFDQTFLASIRMKPVRTLSGVTIVTVLTKPYACPGECIFCPTDAQMPKSYLPDEPGAMRALHHAFDPYEQTAARIEALEAIGHPTEKIELLILGGTWSAYPVDYQEWFIQRCLDAMNGFDSKNLAEAQAVNEDAVHRNVGLVIETRPDHVDMEEVLRLRELGVTKVQMGSQSQDDHILALNKRGHTVQKTITAMTLLRAAGFKIVLHWMPNLLGATLETDRLDFARLWDDPGFRPDEIKIYPCQLLENTELYTYWERGEFTPYSTQELIDLIADIKTSIPSYCRVNRIVRDIPSTHVVAGNKRSSLRQDVQLELANRGQECVCIRCREVRSKVVSPEELTLGDLVYAAGDAEEHFLSLVTPEEHLTGYLRLSCPEPDSASTGLADLNGAAIIREVHIYGQSLEVGEEAVGAAQHAGLGSELVKHAEEVAGSRGYRRMAIISALGTRGYYRRLGYELGENYMVKSLP